MSRRNLFIIRKTIINLIFLHRSFPFFISFSKCDMDNKFLAVFLDHYITSFISQVIIKIVDTEIHSFIIETHLRKELM